MKFKPDLKKYFLRPAEFLFVHEPSLIRTVLGSCVTVTMFSRKTGTAAACHPVLPVCRNETVCRTETCRNKFKYVECIIPEMIRRFKKLGVSPTELEIKLFGGADLFGGPPGAGRIIHVGRMNVQMAWRKLHEMKCTVQGYDVEGDRGRKLFFDTSTGHVWLKRFRADTSIFPGDSYPHDRLNSGLQKNGR